MRGIISLLASLICFAGVAQKDLHAYKLPERATAKDYVANTVVVKIKPTSRSFVDNRSGRVRSVSQIVSIQPLVAAELTAAAARSRGPLAGRSGIDITTYYRAFVQPGQPIEQVINELYATGLFELVEPEFIDRIDYTPNDPQRSQQYYLDLIKAYDAWDITKGNNDVVIAIIDTGGHLIHEDFASKLYVNPNENPNNGTDDDGNGFIDDWRGWDFVGADTLNVNNPNFIGDNDPSIVKGGAIAHGTNVAGCAGAATDNSIGISGVGFNTKILFTKHSGDNQKEDRLSVYRGYSGILYAAELLYANGKKAVINASWGGPFRSQIAQDVITYATLERGALVIGAAGNENSSAPHYPSSYDHVLSVAATDASDMKAGFSNFGKTVDIAAPGSSIRTTGYSLSSQTPNAVYGNISGTSFSSPIVAGAAALVWAHNPTFTATQVAEQLRVTADESFYATNPAYNRLLGKGRLDIKRALTLEFPSLRASKPRMLNNNGTALEPGQNGKLFLTFTNYLKTSTSGTQVTITSLSGSVTILKGNITLGIVPEGTSISNSLNPFELRISTSTPQNTFADILIEYRDGSYSDYQFFTFLINPSFIDIDDNQITTTVASKGRLGFDDPGNQANGTGFVFNENPTLFEMGLIMGSSSATIKNNVRGVGQTFDQDFFERDKIRQIRPGERSYSEVFGSFSDGSTEGNSSLKINYRSLSWRDPEHDKFVIMEYVIRNLGAVAMNNFHFGIFADWDITDHGGADKAAYYNQARIRLGYAFPAQSTELPQAGIQLLTHTDKAIHYAIDNDHRIAGIPFGLYDGFTDEEKFTTISTNRPTSAASETGGNDVSHTVSAGPFSIPSGGEITLAFALHSAFNLDDMIRSAAFADTVYNFTLQAPRPVVPETSVCYGTPATVTATGAGSYKWYSEFTGGQPISTNATLITANLFSDTTLYVSNADNSYESVRTAATIRVKANPLVTASGFTTFCEGQSIILSASEADEYEWSTGAVTQLIEVSEAGDYSVTVKDIALNCEFTSETISVTVNPSPTADFTSAGSGISHAPIQFTDGSTGATSWLWLFGDGASSTQQNPSHQYQAGGDFNVQLTVTSANGCQNSVSKPIDIITGIEREIASGLSIYPNPLTLPVLTIEVPQVSFVQSQVEMITLHGQQVHSAIVDSSNGSLFHQIDTSEFPAGVYVVRVKGSNGELVMRKIVKTR
jgi:serine protease